MKYKKLVLLLFIIIKTVIIAQEDKVFHFDKSEKFLSTFHQENLSTEKSKNIVDGFNVTIKSNDVMRFIWVVNQFEELYTKGFSNEYSFPISDSVIAVLIFFHFTDISQVNYKTFLYEEYHIKSDTIIYIKKEDATQKVEFNFKRQDNTSLILDNVRFVFTHASEQFGVSYDEINLLTFRDYSTFTLRFNKIPNKDFIIPEWLFLGKQDRNNGDFYYFEGELTYDLDTIYQNDLHDLEHVDFNYYFIKAQVPVDPIPKVIFYPTGHSFETDPEYTYPLELSIYYQADTNNYLYANRFYNSVNLGEDNFDNLYTSQMRIEDGKVIGKVKSNANLEFIISETENVLFGYTPTYWFGKYKNMSDKIRIFSPWGAYSFPDSQFNQLFLSQTNDAVPQFPINMEIYDVTKQNLIKDVELTLHDINEFFLIDLGYVREELDFPVEPGIYEVTFTNDKGDLSGTPTTVTAKCRFDLTFEDKNPPGLNSFQILSNNNISHSLNSDNENKIRFMCEDENEISQIELYYKNDSAENWQKIETNFNKHYHTAVLPELESENYSLKLFLKDNSGNSMEMIQSPAFVYENVTSVKSLDILDKFMLHQNYPNPFNPQTTITYQIKERGNVKITIYNILGSKIKELVNENKTAGKYSINFSAENLPSGIYIYRLTSNNFSETKKFTLLK